MRADMYKVVTERPRVGGGLKPKGHHRNTALADLPTKEGIRKPYVMGGITKEFSDLLGPLQRYLRKQVGRLWDKVYSDIVSNMPGGLTARHILSHVEWEVELHVLMVDRQPCYSVGMSYGRPIRKGLYVHPNSGLLCAVKPPKKRP